MVLLGVKESNQWGVAVDAEWHDLIIAAVVLLPVEVLMASVDSLVVAMIVDREAHSEGDL